MQILQEIVRVVILPVLTVAVIMGVFYLLVGRRGRGQGSSDPQDVRTFLNIVGGKGYQSAEERDRDPQDQGGDLLTALHGHLTEPELELGNVEAEDYGFSVRASVDSANFVCRLGALQDDQTSWLLMIDPEPMTDPVEDTPQLRIIVDAIHGAATKLAHVKLRWFARQDWERGPDHEGSARPIEASQDS